MNSKAYTDFNDLHVVCGLEEVSKQINSAISSLQFSPEPPINEAHNFQGQTLDEIESNAVCEGVQGSISQENDAPAENKQKPEINEVLLQGYLNRYFLVEGKTEIWDSEQKTVMKKTAFIALISQKYFKLWSSKRQVISQDVFRNHMDEANAATIQELLDNFVVLAGTQESWNINRRERWLNKAIKEAYPNIYDLWFKSPVRKQIYHRNLIFDPTCSHDLDENYINMFNGLPLDVLRDANGAQISVQDAAKMCPGIISLIHHLCSHEKEAVMFLLKWLAYPLQNMGGKMATCVLMHGDTQGAGKSLLFGKIFKKIYGDYHTTVGQQQLDSNYNEWIENKLFGLFEEIVDNKKKHNVMGMIKHLITGETLYVSKKFVSGWEMDNHLNTVFLSNNTQPLPIEEKDRRFLVLNPTKALEGKLYEAVMQEINSEGIRAFFTVLMGMDLGDFNGHTKPPMTKAKKALIDYSRPGFDTFYTDWKNGETKYPFISCKSEQLYQAFIQWTKKTGEHPISMKRFIGEGRKHGFIPSEKAKHWKGMKKSGQNKIIIIGVKPDDKKEQDWLGLQVEEFQDSLDGIPEVTGYGNN